MDSVGNVLLGVIAVALAVQAIATVAFAVVAARAARDVSARIGGLERELRPQLARLAAVADDLSRVSQRASHQFSQVETAVADATDRLRRTGEAVERVASRPAGLLAAAVVFALTRRYLAGRGGRP
jgi:hypothetical protein